MFKIANPAKVRTASGTWVDLAVQSPDISNYSTTTQMNTAISTGAGLNLISTNSFTAATIVSVDNIFSSTYDNYRLVISATGSSLNNAMHFYYINTSGSNVNSSYYSQISTVDYASNVNTLNALNHNDRVPLGWLGNSTSSLTTASLDIFRPYLATKTVAHGNNTGVEAGNAYRGGFTNSIQNSDTQMRGIYIFNGAGSQMTGKYWIYGYKNS